VRSLSLASQALVELAAGNLPRAEALARQSVSLGQLATPQFGLGKVRFRQGDLAGASHAFQAALLREPEFAEAQVAWAEVWLEQGEWVRVRDTLGSVLQRTPDHGRAALLLAELGRVSRDAGGVQDWESTCQRDEKLSPFTATACELAGADQAWRTNDPKFAVALAKSAASRQPSDPRLLGLASQFLASVGAVDAAAACLDGAIKMASPLLPSLRWARLAIELGRGQLPSLPQDLARSSAWASFLLARMALASGGVQALAAALPGLQNGRPEIEELSALVSANHGTALAGTMSPWQAYVRGLQAQLAGDAPLAAALFGQALRDNGEACRAAGEYLALQRQLAQPLDPGALAELRSENSDCVNLPPAATGEPAPTRLPSRRPRRP
jgi:tetratricopeptide (TPR) repeat protein